MLNCPHCQADLRRIVPAPTTCPACGGSLPSELASPTGKPHNLTTSDIGATMELPAVLPTSASSAADSSTSEAAKPKEERKTVEIDRGAISATVDFSIPGMAAGAATVDSAPDSAPTKDKKKTVKIDPAAGGATIDFPPATAGNGSATVASPTPAPAKAPFDWTKYADDSSPPAPAIPPAKAEKKTVKMDPSVGNATVDFPPPRANAGGGTDSAPSSPIQVTADFSALDAHASVLEKGTPPLKDGNKTVPNEPLAGGATIAFTPESQVAASGSAHFPPAPPAGQIGLGKKTTPAADGMATMDFPAAAASKGPAPGGSNSQLGTLWESCVSPEDRPEMTLKSGAKQANTIINVVIQPRKFEAPGKSLGGTADYELIELLGEGGVGVVFAARQASIDRTVAIKMLKGSLTNDVNHRSKFLSEAVVTGDLDHPNIVPIYDLGSNHSGALFYSMKRVRGTPWSKVIQEKLLTENIQILMSVADAVAFAHARGVLHRDLKPENIMLGDFGEVLVMDWGIALSTPEYTKHKAITQTASMGGTPVYMAPEMASGPLERITTASDVYLLGAILFEIITGMPPHTGKDVMSCIVAAMKNEIQRTNLSGELLDVAYKAMATKPEDRYATVQEFQGAIRQFQSHSESIVLSTRAEDELTKAKQTQDYQDYARALFAFEEAALLWDGNSRARDGVQHAALAYADTALEKGDFDLGVSLLKPENPLHTGLYQRLVEAQKERDARQQRLKNLRRVAAALVAAILLIVTIAYFSIRAKNLEVVASNQALTETTDQLKVSEGNLRVEKVALEENQKRLRREKRRADDAAEESRLEAQHAREAQQRESLATYLAQIGLSAERIATNSFLDADRLLSRYATGDEASFRHWEWGHLRYLCQLDRETLHAGSYVESVACSRRGGIMVAGTAAGKAIIWKVDWDKLGTDAKSTQPRKELARIDHGGPINAVAISADGDRIATGGRNGGKNGAREIKLWRRVADGTSYQLERTFAGNRDTVLSLAFSPDGKLLASSSRDETARLWDLETGTQVRAFRGHFGPVWGVAFAGGDAGHGLRLATAGDDSTVRVWNALSDDPPRVFRGHRQPVFSVAFDPTGRLVVSGGRDKDVLVWEWEDLQDFDYKTVEARLKAAKEGIPVATAAAFHHEPAFRLTGHSAEVRAVTFSDDGNHVLSAGNDNCVKQWEFREPPESANFVRTYRGHGGWVRSCAYSPEARYFVSGGRDELVKIWDGPNYEEVRTLRGHGDVVMWGAYSPNGKYVATAGRDRRAIIWNSQTGTPIKRLDENPADATPSPDDPAEKRHFLATLKEGHEFLVTSAVFFPKGGQLLTSAGDSTVRQWDVATGGETRRFDGTGNVGALAISRDARWVLTGSEGNEALLWRADDPKTPPLRLTGHESTITAVAFSDAAEKQEPLLFTGDALGHGKLWRHDPQNGEWKNYATLKGHVPGFGITGARFLPGHREILTASHDHTVFRWDAATGKRDTQAILKHPDGVKSMDVSADGHSAVTLCAIGKNTYRIFVWDLEKGTERHIDPDVGGGIITMVAYNHDQKSVIITAASGTESSIWRWDLATDKSVPMWPANTIRGTIWSTISSPDGQYLLAVGGSQARLLKTLNGDQVLSFRPHSAIVSIAYSKSGKWLATGGADGDLKIWVADETAADFGKVKFKIPQAHERDGVVYGVASVVFAPTSAEGDTLLLSAGDDGTARLWELNNGTAKPLVRYVGHSARVRTADFSPDIKYVLTASEDHTARLWDTRTGQPVGARDGQLLHPSNVVVAGFSADGRSIITGSDDTIARLWDATNILAINTEPILLKGHTAAISSAAFSPDGRRAVTASLDGMAKLWDTETSTEVLSLRRHTAEMTSVHFSPEGRNILTTSRDGTALIWPTVNITPSVELANMPLEYRQIKTPVVIDPHAQIVDPDSLSIVAGRVTVEVMGEPLEHARERLAIGEAVAQIKVSGNQVVYEPGNGVKAAIIATFTGGEKGTPLILTLDKNVHCGVVELLLRAITYQSETPLEKPRQIRFSLVGNDEGVESLSSASKTVLPFLVSEAIPGE